MFSNVLPGSQYNVLLGEYNVLLKQGCDIACRNPCGCHTASHAARRCTNVGKQDAKSKDWFFYFRLIFSLVFQFRCCLG